MCLVHRGNHGPVIPRWSGVFSSVTARFLQQRNAFPGPPLHGSDARLRAVSFGLSVALVLLPGDHQSTAWRSPPVRPRLGAIQALNQLYHGGFRPETGHGRDPIADNRDSRERASLPSLKSFLSRIIPHVPAGRQRSVLPRCIFFTSALNESSFAICGNFFVQQRCLPSASGACAAIAKGSPSRRIPICTKRPQGWWLKNGSRRSPTPKENGC